MIIIHIYFQFDNDIDERKKKNGKRRTTLHNSNLEFEKPLLTINFFKNIHKSMSSDLSIAKISVNRIAESKFQFSPSLLSNNQPIISFHNQTIRFVLHTVTRIIVPSYPFRTNFLKISITKIFTFPH